MKVIVSNSKVKQSSLTITIINCDLKLTILLLHTRYMHVESIPPLRHSYRDILVGDTMSPSDTVDNGKSPPPPPPDISHQICDLSTKMDGLVSGLSSQQTSQFEQLKSMIETSNSVKDKQILQLVFKNKIKIFECG